MAPDIRIQRQHLKFLGAAGILVLLFGALILRLWYLQVTQGGMFRELSENNRFRTVFLPPPRGTIEDRNGVLLAKNRASFNIEFISADSPNPDATIQRLADILGRDAQHIRQQLQNQRRRHRFEPKVAVQDASREDIARVYAHRYELRGVEVQAVPARQYVEGARAAHALGYTREVSADQLKRDQYSDYRHGDIVGQAGVEQRLERDLQGMRGSQRVIVDARGARVQALPPLPEKIGQSVMLTLDEAVQKAADDALTGLRGAIVAMDAKTGEILALSSAPTYDPNIFTREITPEIWKDLSARQQFKLTNRAVQGTYPPGSVFKVFMAAAILAEEIAAPSERINCPGFFKVGSRVFRCHKKTGHGLVNLSEALIQSCDVYFYTMGQRMGVDRIHEYATRFGLGSLTGIELSDEKAGLIPSTDWKRKAFRKAEDQKWYPGETPSVVIGQGAVSVTPLQITRAMVALANGGKVLQPHILLNQGVQDELPQVVGNVGIAAPILHMVRQMLAGVVYAEHGTGHKAQLGSTFDMLVGGKTGTAQPASLANQKGDHLQDHAWFSGFAPVDKPDIVVTALVENGGHGGATAAPLVRSVIEAFFRARGRELKYQFAGPEGLDIEAPAAVSAVEVEMAGLAGSSQVDEEAAVEEEQPDHGH